MRIFLLGPVPRDDGEVMAFAQAANRLARAGHVPILPYWFLVDEPDAALELRRSIDAMLEAEGVALIKRQYHDHAVKETQEVAKAHKIPVHTLAYYVNDGLKAQEKPPDD